MSKDMENLSKKKYIYEIYRATDGTFHCNKYPIVYINSKVVYFKEGRCHDLLGMTPIGFVKKSIDDFDDLNIYRDYVWDVGTDIAEAMKHLNTTIKTNNIKRRTNLLMERSKRITEELKKIEEELLKLNNE